MLSGFKNALLNDDSASQKNSASSSTQAKITGPSISNTQPFQRRGISVNVVQGDILHFNAEVLVNTTGGDFNLEGKIYLKKKIK